MAKGQWDEMTDLAEVEQVLSESHTRPVVIFKHSNACPISANAYHEMEQHLATNAHQEAAYKLVVVQKARPVSNAIAERLNVEHESPQVILLRNGEAVWHTSHFKITDQAVTEKLQSA